MALSSLAWRAGLGALGGAFMGRNEDMVGMAGGAAAGAAMGAWGLPTASKWLGGKGGISGLSRRGLLAGQRGLTKFRPKQGPARNSISGYGRQAYWGIQNKVSSARKFIGNNSVAINKYGGYALGAMGVGAAGYIGSSVLGSNGGF